MNRHQFNAWLVATIGSLFLTGCGGPYDASVEGVVTLDGKAVPTGMVMFHPVSPGPAAYGLIDSSGSYTVSTGRETGLPSGDYHVSVVANEPPTVAQNGPGWGAAAWKTNYAGTLSHERDIGSAARGQTWIE